MKWVPKGEHSGKFRLATTIFGQCAIDVMLGTVAESFERHSLRSYSVKDFIEELAAEMVDNEFDGSMSRPSLAKRRASPVHVAKVRPSDFHELKQIGYHEGALLQRRCVYCGLKASTYCALEACRGMTICQVMKRRCYERHCGGEEPKDKGKHTPKKKLASLITPADKATPPSKKTRTI